MGSIYTSIDQLVGATPLLELSSIERELGLGARVLVKLERQNPAGSVKDRVALGMLDEAEAAGVIKPHSGYTIVEPTSGNTGVGLAALAAARGYRLVIAMPETMSAERRALLAAYGAELVLTPGGEGMKGAIARAEEIAAATPKSWIAGQFTNPSNPAAHEATTGPEIWEDTDGAIDAFVAGVGTGGTITGAGRYLKEKNGELTVIAVEPTGSPVLSTGVGGKHGIQGIGAGFVPAILNTEIYDEVQTVEDADAVAFAKEIARSEGILVGISSGAALKAAVDWAKKPEHEGKTVVVLLPDSGDRYYSTALFQS